VFKFRFALTMALRETRAAKGKFAFVVLSVALGAAALTSVTGFNESVHYTLLHEARTLMAADIAVRMPVEPSPIEMQYLQQLEAKGIQSTRVTETVSMASTGNDAPVLVSVKGVDFSNFPFYGQLVLDPPRTALDDNTVAVSDDLLLRLGVHVGDSIAVGERRLRIAARIVREPDRMTTGFTLGPRVLFTREGLKSTGILVPGSRITERVLLKLPPNQDLEPIRHGLVDMFRNRARITDYSEANPQLTRSLNRATRFLSLVSLISLIVAGLGVGATMQSHLRQKMSNIAFMKCVGGTSQHIIRIYVIQALLIGLAGSLLGVVLGAFAQAAFARLVASYFDIDVTLIWPVMAMLKGIAVGLTTALLFSLPSLLSIAHVRPAWILRKEVSDEPVPTPRRQSMLAGAAILLGLWLIAIWVGSSVYYASVFAAAVISSVLILGASGWLLLRLLRGLSNYNIVKRSAAVRHGLSNLYRPGAHTPAVLASIGVGVMFTLSVYFLQHSLLDEVRLTAPPDSPNMFLINITDREHDGIVHLLESDPAVLGKQPLAPSVAAQLLTVDGTPLAQIPLEEGARRFLNTQFVLTWARDIPPATEILEGMWWNAQPGEPVVSVQEMVAQALGLKVGTVLEWNTIGGMVRARVANIRRTDGIRVGANNQFILSPGALDGFPLIYYGAMRVKSDHIAAIQAKIFKEFPTVTVINAADILQIIQEVMDRISLAVRFVAGFAIFGGLVVLAASVAGSRYRRMQEIAILKTVGAKRASLSRMFCAEFAVIGLTAGFIGAGLGAILSGVLIGEFLDTGYKVSWLPVLVAALVTAILTMVTGWLASYGILDRKPLDILRQIES
jgi:putative ABC transport system permease protein